MPRMSLLGAAAVWCLLVPGPVVVEQQTYAFDDIQPGALPLGFTLAAARQPNPGTWEVHQTDASRHLVHLADADSDGYGLSLAPGPPLRDVEIAARMRLTAGHRAGGLVWRYQDEHNFFAAVLDLDHRTLFMFRMAEGNRITVKRRTDLELDRDAWHTLKVVHRDASVRVSLGGIRVFDDRDRRLDRFGPGRSGVIATGDSEVWFDDLSISPDRTGR